MNFIFKLTVILMVICGLFACSQESTPKKSIGIVLPLEHKALQEIVAGFTEELQRIYHQPVRIKIMNAEGDTNLQRAIIQQMHDQNYSLIVPIATGVTQMTAAMVHDRPIVSLAADFSETDRHKMKPCNIAVIQDDVPPQHILEFIHNAYPQLTKITLIHSTSDKIFPDVKAAVVAGKKYGIEIKPLMVATLPELVSATQTLSSDSQALFILKDNLIASGIATLIKTANHMKIPLFTSDNGTVEAGAGIALGVHERQIGEEGAKLAAAVLSGKPVETLPIVKMQRLTVFVNKDALQQEGQALATIAEAAKKLNYHIEIFTSN